MPYFGYYHTVLDGSADALVERFDLDRAEALEFARAWIDENTSQVQGEE